VGWGGRPKGEPTKVDDFCEIAQNSVLLKKPHPFERG
jgi:hypothetical protein